MSRDVTLIASARPHELERRAVSELQRYIRLLFGFTPPVTHEAACQGTLIAVGTEASNPVCRQVCGAGAWPGLSEQGYLLRRSRLGNTDALAVVGGSPVATLWAAYELIEEWGVHYLIRGDVFPDNPGPFHLPNVDLVREPVFRTRGFRVINDMANSGVFWSLADHERLFDQLAKLRFNCINISTYPFQPWAHYAFRGVERRTGTLCYGFRHPIHADTIGRELFGNVNEHTNPDFQGCRTYEDWLSAGRRFMHGLIAAAQQRGIASCFTHHLTDFPQEFKDHLVEWSDAERFPPRDLRGFRFHVLGVSREATDPRYAHLMTPLNPDFVDLAESALRAHIEEYPHVAAYGLAQSEFPAASGDYEACWAELDRRHGLERQFPLSDLLAAARKRFFWYEGRAEQELKHAIVSLRMLDILINERRVIQTSSNPDAAAVVTFFSEELQPVVPLVLPPDRVEFAAIVDYLPALVAKRMETLAFARSSPMRVTMITTVEDDNVGFLPQLTTPSLHTIARKMREYGLQGFWFRQFLVTKHEPAMAYLIRAGWDETVTPETVYRRQVEAVCGVGAVEPMLRAFAMIEQMNEAADAAIGLGFLMPGMMRSQWEGGRPPDGALDRLAEMYDEILPHLNEALAASRAAGQPYVQDFIQFVRFARAYLTLVQEVRRARQTYQAAQEQKANKRPLAFERSINETVSRLNHVVELSQTALETWARAVRDPSDLGTLAALNAYVHDYLRGMAWSVYLESQHWGIAESTDA